MGNRGERSRATEEGILRAALAVLGDGPPGLAGLGLTQEAIAEKVPWSPKTVSWHFGKGARRPLQQALAEFVRRQIIDEAARNAEDYAKAAQFMRDGARVNGREMLRQVLLDDLADYQADDTAGTRGRERLYYLMLALCDLAPRDTGVNYARVLRATTVETQAGYAPVYDEFCSAAHREYVVDRDRTQRAINAYLEGVVAHRRFGMAPSDDEIVDTVLRLFYATTKPVGGADISIDSDLFGSAPPQDATSIGAQVTVHRVRQELYTEIAVALESLTLDETLLHCALHSAIREDEAPRDPLTRRLWTAQQDHVNRGGRLRRIARFDDVNELDTYVEWLQQQLTDRPGARVETRVLVMDAPPALSPMVAGERLGALGREDRTIGGITDGVCFTDPHGVAFCAAVFNSIWTDARSYSIASPSGIDRAGVRNLRRSLTAAQH